MKTILIYTYRNRNEINFWRNVNCLEKPQITKESSFYAAGFYRMLGWLIRIIEWNYFNEHECNIYAWKKLHRSLEWSSKSRRKDTANGKRNHTEEWEWLSKCTGSLSLAFIKKQLNPVLYNSKEEVIVETQIYCLFGLTVNPT